MITPLVLVIGGSSIASLLVGVAIGRLRAWDKLDETRERIKAEALAELERDKRATAESLAQELSTIRDGIISTAEAYGRVVKVVEDRLGGSDKLYLNREGEQKVISVDIAKESSANNPKQGDAGEHMDSDANVTENIGAASILESISSRNEEQADDSDDMAGA
jgi:hypothetical protein